MDFKQHGTLAASAEQRQAGNQSWWTDNTMSYDWKDRSQHARFSPEWYAEIDERFLHGARLFSDAANPFVALMGLDQIAGKRVLEIGCGMGMHSEMFTKAGAKLTSIDLSPTSVEATTRRLALHGLPADVRQMDAEHLDFADGEFDLVWSWGVIHHSAHTGRVLKQIHRVMKPGAAVKLMVYNLDGMPAYVSMVRKYLWGFWRNPSLDEILWNDSDGYTARFYTRDQWEDLLDIFFADLKTRIFGQDADAVPVPRHVRPALLKMFSVERQRAMAAKRGSMLYTEGRKAD